MKTIDELMRGKGDDGGMGSTCVFPSNLIPCFTILIAIAVSADVYKPDEGKVGNLRFKIQSVADGKMVDAYEAVAQAQAGAQSMDGVHPVVKGSSTLVGAVDTTGVSTVQTFTDMLGPVLDHLQFIQTLGNRLSEVISIIESLQ